MPPYCITEEDLEEVYAGIKDAADELADGIAAA
jgi:adenosylmethionine-8-amino-7-oxononanoate aminotransferase